MWETDTKYCFVHMSKQNERNVRKNGLHCVSLRRTLCAQKNSKQTDFAVGFLILIFDLFRAQTKKPKTFLMLKWNGSQFQTKIRLIHIPRRPVEPGLPITPSSPRSPDSPSWPKKPVIPFQLEMNYWNVIIHNSVIIFLRSTCIFKYTQRILRVFCSNKKFINFVWVWSFEISFT